MIAAGFVSYVLTNSGLCNTGRLGAQGLYNISTPVSDPQPGDLVFFVGTYDTSGVSHVGIYVGDGMMLALRRPHPVFQPEHKLLAVPFLRIRQTAVQLMEVMKHQYGFLRGRRQQHRPSNRAAPAPYPGGPDPLCGYGSGASPHLRLSGCDGFLAEGPRDAAHYQVYKTTRDGKRLTLEDECLQSCSLPSIAYGFKRCSLKHKIGPQEKFCNHYPPCRRTWAAGKRVVKFIGYDAGEGYRSDKVLLGDLADRKYSKWYPLMEWGWTRDDCIRQIEAAGLPQPGKSSCFFCPSMKPDEITALREQHPDLFRRALALEDNARKNLKTVKGLGRNYSWRERFGKEFCTHGNG